MTQKRKTLFTRIIIAAITCFGLTYVPSAHAATQTIVSEPFTGASTTPSAWIYGGDTCLTAAASSAPNSVPACPTGDTLGNGTLRLTQGGTYRSGFAIYNQAFSSSQGLKFEFDQYQYGGGGADGISFFLVNGSANPLQPGNAGGALGYSDDPGQTGGGIDGGYIGVGLDAWGNYSSPIGGPGGPGSQANSIVIRGSEATGYQYIVGTPAKDSLHVTTNNRATAKRHVVITLSTKDIMTVQVNYGSGLVTELPSVNLATINGAGTLPPTFKFGFAAGSGTVTDYHEISNLTVTTLAPNLSITANALGGFRRGGTTPISLQVQNNSGAGPTTSQITVTSTLPSDILPISASGAGWSCSIAGQNVTCDHAGGGSRALPAGDALSPITLKVRPSQTSSLSDFNFSARVTTTDDSDPTDDTSSFAATIATAGSADPSAIIPGVPNTSTP